MNIQNSTSARYLAISDDGNVSGGRMIEIDSDAALRWLCGKLATMVAILCTVFVGFMIISNPARAGFKEGRDAFIKGDWQTVKSEMLPLAQDGNAKAQIAMGLLYARGQSVEQSWNMAEHWFMLAELTSIALNKNERVVVRILARQNRIFAARKLTLGKISPIIRRNYA